MGNNAAKSVSRRRFLKAASASALAASAGPAVIIPGRAQPTTLRILTKRSFRPILNDLLLTFTQAWADENGVKVVADIVKEQDFARFVAADVAAQKSLDIIGLGSTEIALEDQVIDHREIYEECERRYGKFPDFALRVMSGRPGGKLFKLSYSFVPWLLNYRKDLWDAVGMVPETWEDIRRGGRIIKLLHEKPVGISLSPAPDWDGEHGVRSLLYSFGGTVQNDDNQPSLRSKETLEAIKFAKVLFEEAMDKDMLNSDVSVSNNRAMLAGDISTTLNPISITRVGENKNIPGHELISLARLPQGPIRRLGPIAESEFRVLKFSRNVDLASQFLTDLVGQSREEFIASRFFRLPLLSSTVPDMKHLLANDPKSMPSDKYQVLMDVVDDCTNIGNPGFNNVAVEEIHKTGLIPKMFITAATGKMTPEESMTQADQEVRKVFDKWRALGKV